ncbi:Putative plasmid partition protein (plasmid) [Borrelia crocidurae DOU]|uniref:Putative plasmid partition protein n=2 Tax=Borrelia crocidurae TaxID=29520 RepID=W5SKY1_9SPIR|nr:Putative plasmid partition protein [Borrelia crocidurae DOU]
MQKRINNMEINRRIMHNDKNIIFKNNKILSAEERRQERYDELKLKLKSNLKENIYNKLEAMKILKEIKDNDYYKLDGYKRFSEFLGSYKVAKSQAYNYLKIATAIEKGLLEEQYVLENGFREVLSLIRIKEGVKIKKSRQSGLKSLKFHFKSQESYDFYRQNVKFASFLMDTLFKDEKKLLEEFMHKFKDLEHHL